MMDAISITTLLSKYQYVKPKDYGVFRERQYPVSAVIDIIRELHSSTDAIKFAEWLSENEWVKRAHTHPSKVGQYFSHKHCQYRTIEKLFDVFIGNSELYKNPKTYTR